MPARSTTAIRSHCSHTIAGSMPDGHVIRSPFPMSLTGGSQCICSGQLGVARGTCFSPQANGIPSRLEPEKQGASLSSTPPNTATDMDAVAVLVSLLYEYARKVLLDSIKRGLLRLKCLARLGLQQKTSSLAWPGHTILANLENAIGSVENAIYNADTNAKAEELERAEHIFNAMIVLHAEGLTDEVPNAYIVGCAHLYLALIWKLKKNRKCTAGHLLEAFAASPRYARHDFATELWNQLFYPHMISIEFWYDHEYNAIDANLLDPGFVIAKPSLPTPKWEKIEALLLQFSSHTNTNSIGNKEHRRTSVEGYDTAKLMHVERLNNLFEEALNEATRQFAQFYQNCLINYGERQGEQRKEKELKANKIKGNKSSQLAPEAKIDNDDQVFLNGLIKSKQQSADHKNYQRLAPPLRKSLFEAVFGSSMVKANKVFGDLMLKASCDNTEYHQFCHHNAVYDSMEKEDTKSSNLQHFPKQNHCTMGSSQATFQPIFKQVRDIREVVAVNSERKSDDHIKQVEISKRSLTRRAPDVFVCRLTGNIYTDPVTLETGHTYERCAIEKWLNSGKSLCPLSGHPLRNLALPMTNFTMKALVEKWKMENPDYTHWINNDRSTIDSNESNPDISLKDWTEGRHKSGEFPDISCRVYSTIDEQGNTIVTSSQKSDSRWLESVLNNLKPEISTSWSTKELSKCEGALLKIAEAWAEWKCDLTVEIYLMKEEVVDAFIYLLRMSMVKEVLKATTCMLVSLMQKSDFVKKQILRTDPEFESIFSAASNGHMPDIVLLIFFLNQVPNQKQSLDIIPLLLEIIQNRQVDCKMEFPGPLTPKQIALQMMEQVVTSFDFNINLVHCKLAMSLGILPCLIDSINSENIEERTNATSIITRCMQSNCDCRYYVATCLNLSSILELLHVNGIRGRAVKVAVDFFLEIIRLNRKKSIINILSQIQKDGLLNTMHLLLVVIQCTSLENQPLVAGLLFMLVILEKPQKYSLFREEAINAMLVSLTNENNTEAQANSARVLANLGCHFSISGDSIIEAWLLKEAGLASCIVQDAPEACSPRQIIENSIEEMEEEKMACQNWDRMAARALLSHGEPLFVALGKGLCNANEQVVRHCLIVITWLSCFLVAGGDEMIRSAVCNILEPKMKKMVKLDQEGAIEERIFGAFALQNYRNSCIIKSDHYL